MRDPLLSQLAKDLPDLPRWVEARGMLLSGRCRMLGPAPGAGDYLLRGTDRSLAVAVGRPDPELIARLAEQASAGLDLLVPSDTGDHVARQLPGWEAHSVLLHLHDPRRGIPAPDPRLELRRLLPADDHLLGHVPEELRSDLSQALLRTRIVAAFVNGRPVSFCAVAWETEGLWDVAVETLPKCRRLGLARATVSQLMRHMEQRGKRAVWGALADNVASLALAEDLGFRPVDKLLLLSPGGSRRRFATPRW